MLSPRKLNRSTLARRLLLGRAAAEIQAWIEQRLGAPPKGVWRALRT